MATSKGSNLDRSRFTFQHPWFDSDILPDWQHRTTHLLDKSLSILEVGCFEGASTTWILDNLMSHPSSTLVAIDSFEGGMEHQNPLQYDLPTLEQRFHANVALCPRAGKLSVMKTTSEKALLELRQEGRVFDFVYIDASHVALDVLSDALLAWRMISLGGTIVFDDFTWKGYMEDCYNPRIAIRSFLDCAEPEIEYVETEFQVWGTKVPRKFEPTPNPDPAMLY